jgi:hypothetical protein
MATLQKAIDMFNAIPIKIPMTFLTTEMSILRFTWKYKKPQITKAILSKKKHTGEITIAAFILYYRAIGKKAA